MKDIRIPRDHYLDMLRSARDLPVIKTITGMRRCGKSTLMEMFRDEIRSSGVSPERVFHINLDDETEVTIETHFQLMNIIKDSMKPEKGTYIFIDEVQNIPEWERAVESLRISGADVYITGSNSKMLSSEIATKLSGRYIEIPVYPLAFSEYLLFRETYGPKESTESKFSEYIRYGGLPAVALMAGERRDLVSILLEGTYATVYEKDVIERKEVRNAPLLSNISRFLMKNIGDRTSVKNIVGYLGNKNIKTSAETVDNYIGFLESAFLFYKAKRFDSKTKEYLRTSDKYYACDIGIRNERIGFRDTDLDGILENIVFMELMYRYGNAAVLSVNGHEVDFMATEGSDIHYFQISMSIADAKTKERELGALRSIDDNHPKTIVTLDRYPIKNIDGIRIVNVIDFLTE
ncbi:MAG: ATP-binding protein [Candidatus Methanoplasma sp.]|jgi:predicted AAA+ superfamily ATPase|nr:ATP-binding protein [Candidatus Methanoplasma sp.]